MNEIMDVLNEDSDYPVLRWYVHGVSYIDERLMMYVEIDTSEEPVETPYYYAIDRMYDVRYLLDQTGAIVESYAYDPYGRPLIRECAGRGDMTGNSVLNFTANHNQFTRSRNCQIFDPRADMNADGVVDVNDQSAYDIKKLIWTGSAPSSVKTARSLVGNPYMFQGRPHFVFDTEPEAEDAELMLNDHRARFADPMTGRWVTRDPIGYVDSMNLFEMLASAPTSWFDPEGEEKDATEGTRLECGKKHPPHVPDKCRAAAQQALSNCLAAIRVRVTNAPNQSQCFRTFHQSMAACRAGRPGTHGDKVMLGSDFVDCVGDCVGENGGYCMGVGALSGRLAQANMPRKFRTAAKQGKMRVVTGVLVPRNRTLRKFLGGKKLVKFVRATRGARGGLFWGAVSVGHCMAALELACAAACAAD